MFLIFSIADGIINQLLARYSNCLLLGSFFHTLENPYLRDLDAPKPILVSKLIQKFLLTVLFRVVAFN